VPIVWSLCGRRYVVRSTGRVPEPAVHPVGCVARTSAPGVWAVPRPSPG